MSENLRFIGDGTVGKLVKYLRFIGVDVVYETDEEKILKIAKDEKRIILSRNQKFKEFEDLKVFVFTENEADRQLKKVVEHFNIKPKFFIRCSICNTLLKRVRKEKVKGKVPYYIYITHDDFAYCPKCNKFYWEGTHTKAIREKLLNILKEGRVR